MDKKWEHHYYKTNVFDIEQDKTQNLNMKKKAIKCFLIYKSTISEAYIENQTGSAQKQRQSQ